MRKQLNKSQDMRINAKRPFWKEFLIIWGVVLISCTGSVLIFNQQMADKDGPIEMVIANSLYVFFVGLVVSIVTRYIMYSGFSKPILELAQAAKKIAQGDFTVRVRSQRKDDKKDELEVLIDDFNKMAEELATNETLKGDFIVNVSHEIKTPLAIIQNYAAALRKEELSKEDKGEYIITIMEASHKLSELVSNILRLNKLENQEIIQVSPYSLDEQLRFCILALEDRFDEKNIEFEADLEEITIATDESLMEIAWNNLLTNAIKFTEPGGKVKVGLKRDGGNAVVSVSDNGCGMNEETSRRIFDRFYQGDTSHSTEGNGLGLSLVKRVIELAGGTIQVDSEPEKGTTFNISMKL